MTTEPTDAPTDGGYATGRVASEMTEPVPESSKKPLTPQKLAQLELARARAVEVRKQKAAERAKEKELLAKQQAEIELLRQQVVLCTPGVAESSATAVAPEPDQERSVPKETKPKRKKIIVEESESEDDVEYVVVRRKPKQTPAAPSAPVAPALPAPEIVAQRELQQEVNTTASLLYRKRIDDMKRDLLMKQMFG